MTTLKSLVDETTNIKNEIVECHSNLSSILASKNIEVSEEDKISDLIGKVDLLGEYNKKYLIKDGDLCASITGGWSYYNAGLTTSVGNGYISVPIQNGPLRTDCSYFSTNNPIDLAGYNKLKIEFKNNGTVPAGMRPILIQVKSMKTNDASGLIAEVNGGNFGTTVNNKTILSLDISSINQRCYITDTTGSHESPGTRTDFIYNIWLEK